MREASLEVWERSGGREFRGVGREVGCGSVELWLGK